MSFQALGLFQVLLFLVTTAAAIVFLYWLKPPPQRVIVPSTLIWARVLKERKRRSDFWRWLVSLLVALAVGLLLVSSIGKPEVEALSGRARRIAVVIDNSPTMATTTATGQSRWEVALQRTRELLNEGSVASEYLVTDTSGQLPGSGFTSRVRALELLDELTPSLKDSVRFPEGDPSLEPDLETDVYLISDGVLIQDVPSHVTTISVFEPADNVGITAFDLRPVPAEPTRYEGFLEISNYSTESKRVVIQLDGTAGASDQRAITLGAGEVLGESLNVDNFLAGPIRVLIDAPDDGLELDNVAYTYLAAPRRVRTVLVTGGNAYLETLLDLDPRVALETIAPDAYQVPDSAEEMPELYVFDRFAPADKPLVPALMIRPSPAEWLPALTGQDMTELSLAGVRSDHPLLEHVSLEDVVVETAAVVSPGDYEVVAGTAEQPILLVDETPLRWAQLTFDLGDSNFPLQSGFPIFLANAVAWLTSTDVVTTQLGTITVPATIAAVTDMRGDDVPTRTVGALTAFTPDAPGLFSVRTASGDVVISANLLSPDVSAVNASAFAGEESAGGLVDYLTGSVGGGELWLMLLLVALVLVLVEWWTYNRRMTV
jgi:Ca-activated chloride channel family protein